MKKITAFLAGAALMLVTASAWAIPATWTDVLDFNQLMNRGDNFRYTHDIKNEGFVPLADTIISYRLELDLDNITSTSRTKAYVDLPGLFDGGYYNFYWDDNTFGMSLSGWLLLETTGTYCVSIYDDKGTFVVDKSTLI